MAKTDIIDVNQAFLIYLSKKKVDFFIAKKEEKDDRTNANSLRKACFLL